VLPNPPNANGESESLRTNRAKFESLVSIHRVEEIGDDKGKVMPYGSREVTIPNTMEKSPFICTTLRIDRGGIYLSMVE
jgi:hypothetical protein